MAQRQFMSSLLGATASATACLRVARCAALPRTLAASTRTFSSLPTLRPTLISTHPVFRTPTGGALSRFVPPTTTSAEGTAPLDLVPRSAISAHPALAGPGAQIRCGPRPHTMNGATRLVQKRRHGFLTRLRTKNGRKLIARRRAKGRLRLGATN